MASRCGDDVCEDGETPVSCPLDCGGCGNGALDPAEACDGTLLGEATCASLGYGGGVLTCAEDCAAFEVAGCCDHGCEMVAETRCASTLIQECAQTDGACRQWLDLLDCADTQEVCRDGSGTPGCCREACGPTGEIRCSEERTGREVCTADVQGCTQWQPLDDCDPGTACQTPDGTSLCLTGGEDCLDPIELSTGANLVRWTASDNTFLASAFECIGLATGPDVVLRYTATATGHLDVQILNRAPDAQWAALVAGEPCTLQIPVETCLSAYPGSSPEGTFPVTAGTTYYFYVVALDWGTGLLPNPFEVVLTQLDCGDPSVTVTSSIPSAGATDIWPDSAITMQLSARMRPDLGTVTVTGTGGTSLVYDLSQSPPEVTFADDHRRMVITPPGNLHLGETVTVSLAGLQDELCGTGLSLPPLSFQVRATVPPGEDCSDPLQLQTGLASYPWFAAQRDYFSWYLCGQTIEGGDVVGVYTATVDGHLSITLNVPSGANVKLGVYDAPCGDVSSQLGCGSSYTSLVVPITAGSDYAVYIADRPDDGPVPNPLELILTEISCPSFSAQAVKRKPPHGGTTQTLTPVFFMELDVAPVTTDGTVMITGDQGTSLVYAVNNAPEIDFWNHDRRMIISPGVTFPPGENLTITWTQLTDSFCGNPIPSVPWSVSVIVPPCQPGTDGLVGTTVTQVGSQTLSSYTSNIVADANTSGWIYLNDSQSLYRVPKAGGALEDIKAAAGLSSFQCGLATVINGPDIFTVNTRDADSTGMLWRISTDGGVTWNAENFAYFPTALADGVAAARLWDGRIYLMAGFGGDEPVEIWSVNATPARIPDLGVLEGWFHWENSCRALVVDDQSFYVACDRQRLLRLDRADGPWFQQTLVTDLLDTGGSAGGLHAVDTDHDGLADVLYLRGDAPEVGYVCDPAGAAYVDTLVTLATGHRGLGYDPAANTLWLHDHDTGTLISVH